LRIVRQSVIDAATAAARNDLRGWFGVAAQRLALALFSFRDFLTVNGDIARCFDADADLRAVHRHHGYFDIVANAQAFTGASGEYQHEGAPAG
jgi:hypothetical protein